MSQPLRPLTREETYTHEHVSEMKACLRAEGVPHAADFSPDGAELSGGGNALRRGEYIFDF